MTQMEKDNFVYAALNVQGAQHSQICQWIEANRNSETYNDILDFVKTAWAKALDEVLKFECK